jgi:hypothetical protein
MRTVQQTVEQAHEAPSARYGSWLQVSIPDGVLPSFSTADSIILKQENRHQTLPQQHLRQYNPLFI